MPKFSKRYSCKKIKAFLFDLGKVILDFDFTPAFKKLSKNSGISPQEVMNFFMQSGLEVLYDGGKITSQEFHRKVKKGLGHSLDFGEFKKVWNEIFTPNPKTVQLIKDLKNSHRLVLISNTNQMHFEYAKKKYPVLQNFDHWVLSYKEKCRKPDERIYRAAIQACRAKPHEILYIDDRADLTSAADELGLQTFTFKKNYADLTEKMVSLEVL